MLPASTGSFFPSYFVFVCGSLGDYLEKICNLSLHQTTQVKRLIVLGLVSSQLNQDRAWAVVGMGWTCLQPTLVDRCQGGPATLSCLAVRAHYVPVPCGPSARAWGFCSQWMDVGRGVLGLLQRWMLSLRPWWELFLAEPCCILHLLNCLGLCEGAEDVIQATAAWGFTVWVILNKPNSSAPKQCLLFEFVLFFF